MFFTRQQLEEIEDKSLAPYGMRSRDSKGRAYLDNEPQYRTAFQRDRDRILHTTAFRGSNTRPRSSSTTKATTSAPA
jgi:dGTPase